MITEQDIVYISGPMTGIPEFNKPLFNWRASTLRFWYGCEVINPADLGEDGYTWTEFMRADLAAMERATVLFQLPDWQNSRGAVIEHDVAVMGGLLVLPFAVVPYVPKKYHPDNWKV